MTKRRTNAEIEEVRQIHDRTRAVANEINDRVNQSDDDPNYITVDAAPYWHNKAEYQREVADTLTVSFSTKDPAEMERVAMAMKAALDRGTK